MSGTPTAAGTCSVTGFAYVSEGNYKSAVAKIAIAAAPAGDAVLTSASVAPITATKGTTKEAYFTFTLDDPDDGSYSYVWTVFNGSGTGFGYLYVSTDGGSTYKLGSTGTTYTNSPMFAISGSAWGSAPTGTGSPDCEVTITDSAGNHKSLTCSVTIS